MARIRERNGAWAPSRYAASVSRESTRDERLDFSSFRYFSVITRYDLGSQSIIVELTPRVRINIVIAVKFGRR